MFTKGILRLVVIGLTSVLAVLTKVAQLMRRDDAQSLVFIVFVFTAACGVFTNSPIFTVPCFISGVVLATLLTVDYLK